MIGILCALLLAGTATAATTPDVPTAVGQISATLDWMHTSKKTGGLGYSIAQAQRTHAYLALLALGGAWPPPVVPPTPTTGCFASPIQCGYHDPAAGNVGIPPGTLLSPSGSITTATNGQVINAKNVTGTITVATSNVTIQNTQVTSGGGSGSCAINIANGATGTLIQASTIQGISAQNPLESAVCDHYGEPMTVDHVVMQLCADCIEEGAATATVSNSYLLVNATYPGAHNEDVYFGDGNLTLTHDTLLNTQMQTATVFGDTHGGGGGPCDNHLTVTGSLLAGGGFMLYPCGNSSSAGQSTMTVTGNRFARCVTAPVFNSQSGGSACAGGQDSHGYWPAGGYFGTLANAYCGAPGQTWSGNVWDDTGATIAC